MSLLDEMGKQVRDVIYEGFHEYTKTVDLEEIKEKGFLVREFRLSSSGMDKLYILSKDEVIQMGGVIIVEPDTLKPIAHLHGPIETMNLLKHLRGQRATSESLAASKTNRNGELKWHL